jgi:Zn-dependent alcohol dehydrogenase
VLPATGATVEVREVELAAPGPGEVLVRLQASGVCHSDLNAVDGTSATRCAAVLGHEGAGVVEAVGGCGGVGLSALLGAVAIGASPVVAVDVSAEKLITHRLPLGSAAAALELVRAGRPGRTVLELN